MKANYCINCGAALSEKNQFCGHCGTPKGQTDRVVREVPATIGNNNHTDAGFNWLVIAGVLIGGFLLIGFLVSMGSESNSAPSVAASVAAPSVAPTSVPAEVIPPSQKSFTSKITSFISLYNDADTEVRKTDVRFQRRQAIASYFAGLGLGFEGWVGQVKALRTESDGEAYISIRLRGTDIEIKTWNNSLSDVGDHTMIRRSDALYTSLRDIKEGDEVTVAGSFIEADKDYIREASMTEQGSMTDPEFIVRFSHIRKGVQPLEDPDAAPPESPKPAEPPEPAEPTAGGPLAQPTTAPEYAQPTVTVTYPERICRVAVSNLRDVDFKNFRYPMGFGPEWVVLSNGTSPDQDLTRVWYLDDGVHALASLDYTGGPESKVHEGVLLLFELRNGNLVNTQTFEYYLDAVGAEALLDTTKGQLTVKSRSDDGSGLASPEHLDLVRFIWDGEHFQMKSATRIPVGKL